MGIDVKTVNKIPEAVDKIKTWVGNNKGLILIFVVVIAVIALIAYKQNQKKEQGKDSQVHHLKKGVKPVYPGQEINPGDVE